MIGEESKTDGYFLIEGVKKLLVLNQIKYWMLTHNLLEEYSMHPDIVHKLETLHDNVQHNMPVEKDLVFELVPELFSFEMRKLTTEQQLDYKGRQYEYLRADGV